MINSENLFPISDDEVHIWKYSLEPGEYFEKYFYNQLSDKEKNELNKIRIPDVRNRRISSKVIVKSILSGYLGLYVKEIRFSFNKFGKPIIRDSINLNNLNFNISHSGNLGILALAKGKCIGVDVERINEIDDLDAIIKLCFTDSEKQYLKNLSPFEKTKMFYKIWTGKEAFIKAIGKGFFFPLKNISFKLKGNENFIIAKILDTDIDPGKWQIYNFEPVKNYTSTLIVNGNSFNVKEFNWSLKESIN